MPFVVAGADDSLRSLDQVCSGVPGVGSTMVDKRQREEHKAHRHSVRGEGGLKACHLRTRGKAVSVVPAAPAASLNRNARTQSPLAPPRAVDQS
jgi:hypothetical protein